MDTNIKSNIQYVWRKDGAFTNDLNYTSDICAFFIYPMFSKEGP